jgi:hypothetical protein
LAFIYGLPIFITNRLNFLRVTDLFSPEATVFVNKSRRPNGRRTKTMAKKSSPKKTVHRSSTNGRFVKESYAKKHPNTTEKERVNVGK